jgi:hypothetical protein
MRRRFAEAKAPKMDQPPAKDGVFKIADGRAGR